VARAFLLLRIPEAWSSSQADGEKAGLEAASGCAIVIRLDLLESGCGYQAQAGDAQYAMKH
jgi:hypothetical protein